MFFKISKFTKILAFATAVIFTLQSSLFASPTAALVSNASNVNSHLADSLDVPSNLGIVDHRYQANQSKEPFIIQIQDAHGQPEAQHHIHALLDYLTKNYDAKIISVESAFSKIEPELLKIFKDQTLNEAFVESLLQMGEVTGVETFALENKDPSVRILGAEDPRLYKESFKLYQKIQNAQNDWQPQLDQYQKIIDQLQMSIFQGELREYFLKQAEWRQQRENSLEYLILIRDYAKKYLNIDLNDQRNQFDWPALVRLMAIKNLEVNFNIETAFAEKEQLLGLFQEVFKNEEKKREYFNFVIDSFFKQQNIDEPISFKSNLFPQVKSARDFFETLRFETKDQIELLRFPHLLDMAGSYILREELDAARLLKELDRIEKKIQMSLVKTKGEKELLELSYGLDLLKKLFSLELSKDDFLHYQKQKKQLSSDAFQQRLNSFEKKFPKRDDKGGNFPQALMDEAEQFYELSLERDVSLIQNTLRHIEKGERNKPTILISGGFHTEGIGAVLKEKGISHVTISPKMSEIATEAIYRDAMLGHNLPYETGTIGKFLFAQAEESYRLGPLTPNDRVFLLISALQDFFSEQNELLDLETIVSQIREALTKLNPQAKFAIKVSSDGQRLELSIESEGIERNFALVDRGPTKLKSWPRGQERVLDSGIRSEMRLELDESVKKLLETIPDDNHGKRIRAALQSVLKLKNNTLLNDEKIDANQKSERGPFRSTKTDSVATPSRRVYNIENIANEAFNNHKIHDSNLPLLHKLIFALTVFDAKYFPDIHQAILNFISKHDLKDLASRTQIETEEYVELVRAYSKAERTMKASDNVLFRYAMNDLVLRMPRSERVAMEREYNATQMIKEIEQPGTGDVPTVIFFTDWHGATRIGSLIAKALGIEDYDRIYSVREMERRLIEQWKKDNPTEKEKSITVEEILAEKNVIIVGGSDYVDRGPKPYWGFQFNVWLRKHGKLRFINGNHDLWKDWNILGFHLRVNDELENIAKSGLIADSHIEEHVRRIDRFFTTPTLTKDQKTFSEILTILENIESQSDAQAIKAAYAILKKKFPKAVQGKEENLQNLLDLKKTTAEKLEAVEKKLQEIDASKRRIVKEFLALKRTKGITQDDIQTFADMIIDSAENANHSLEWWAREWGIHGGWFDTFLDHINEDLINGLITEANQAFANLSDDEREKLLNYLKNPETIPGEVRDDVMSFAAEFLKNLDVSDGVPFQAFDVGDFMKNEQVSAIKKTIKDKRAKNLAARTAYEQKVAAGEEATLTQEKVPSPIEVTARLAQEYVDDIKQKVRLLNRLVSSYEVIDQEPTIVTQQNYRQNPLVAETVLWDLKNARFVYVDAFDNPYTHGILPIIPETHDINVKYETPKGSHLSGIDAVERMQYDIRRFFDEYDALNDGPEFRELMEAKLRNAMLVLVDWYSDRTAELKPGKLGSFLEEGGPGAFNFDGKRSSLYNDRIFDPAKGVWHVGHLDREKIKKINVDYWVGGIVAALLHGDYDASEGYTGFGAIITWLAKEIDGTRSGVRRSGYAVTASSIEKAIKGLKDEQKKMQAEIDAEKKPEHFVLEKWEEMINEGIPKAIKELEKQKADLEKNGEKIVDLTFEDDISPLQIERIRRYHSGENLMVFKVEQFLTDNIATYRSLIDTAPNFGRENRIPYFKRKLKEAKEELEEFRKKRVYLLVDRVMGFTTEVDVLLGKSLKLVNQNKFGEALESATQARDIAREMLDEASEDNGLAATAETIESIYDFVESLARSELRANIDPSTIPSTFGAYGDYPKIELELAKGFALHLHAGALSLANATIGESVSITAYEDAFHLDSLMTTLESQTESGRETLQKLRNNVEMIKSFRRLRNEVFGELTTKNRWSEEEANVFIEKFEALVRVVYAIDLIDESMRESALKKWQEFQERYQQLPREGKTPGSQKLNPMALNIFFSEMRKLWTEEEIHTIEAVDSFNKFINWMHSRVEENVFNLNEKNKYGLIDLDELVKQKKSPSRKVFEGLDAENQNILFEGNSVWLVKRLGIHHMEAYANFASPELGGLIEFNYLEEQDMKKGNVLRLKLMRTYFENLGFTVSSYRADGKDMKLYSPNALRIKLGSEAKSVNELISKMRYGFEFLSNLFNTDLMLGDLAVGYEDFELVEDPDKPAPVFRIARDASGSAAMARMDYANQAMERLVVAWAQKARRVGGRLYFSGSPTSLIEDPTSRNKWKVPDKDEFEREGARVVTSERRGIRATTDTRGAIVDYFWDGEDPYSDTQTVAFDRYARKIYNILQAHLRELKLEEMPPFDMESFDQIFIDQHYNEAIVRAVKKGSLNWQEGKLSINKDYVPFIPEIQFISQWQDNPETMVLMGSYLHKVLLSLQPSGEIGDAHIEVGEFSFLDASITVTVARRNSDGRIVAATVYSHEKDRYLSPSEVYTILKANNMSSRQIPNISDERIESYIRANDSTFKAISSNDIFIGKPFVGQAFLSGVRSGTIVFKAKQLPSEDQTRRNRALHIGDILFTSKMTDADLNVLKQTSLGGVVTQQGVQNSHLNTAAKTIGKPRVNLSSGRIDSDGLWLMKASELSKAIIEEGYRIRLAPEDSRDWIELQEGDLVTMNGNTGTVYWVGQDDADLLEAHRLISELMNFQQEIAVNSNTVKIDAALVEKGEEYEANLISFVNRMGRESKLEPIQFILQQIFFSDFNAVSFNREALISSVAEIARQKATLKKHLQQILLYSQYRLLASFQIASNEIQISLRIDQVYSILDKLNLEATRYFNLAQSLRPLLGSEVDHREIALWIQNINKQFKDKLASLKVRLEETLANFYQENDGKALDLTRFFLLKRLSERVLEFNRLGLNFDPKDESVAYVFDNYKRLGDEIKVLHAAAVSEEKVLLPFPTLEIEFSDLVGNKAGNLGWLDHFLDWYREQGHEGIALAPGFGVTNAAWQQFLRVSFAGTSSFSSSTIGEFIDKVLQSRLSYEEKENQIAKAFDISNVTDELIKNILNGLPDLEKKKPRAVRSSTTVEDSPDDAAAGLFRSNLGANHEESIFKSLLDTWSSFFSARALAYREASLEEGEFLSVYDAQGAIIQELVDADVAGVTTSASMNDRTEIITEAGYGLGISIVDATQDADSWVFHKTTGQIDPQKTRLGLKRTKVVYDAENASVKTVVIKDETLRNKYSLDNKMVVKIAKLVAEIERWYGYVVQVEWAVKDGVLYVKQVRPLPGFKVTPERKAALQRWLDSEVQILDSDTRHELRNSEEILKQLRESTHVIDWTEGLKALQEDDAENQIAVTLHLARGVKLPFQVDRRILTDKELNRRLHRFLAAWAYNAGTIFGTDFIAADLSDLENKIKIELSEQASEKSVLKRFKNNLIDFFVTFFENFMGIHFWQGLPLMSSFIKWLDQQSSDLRPVHIAELKRLLAEDLGNIRETRGDIKHKPYGIGDYANAGKEVRVVDAKSVELAAEPSSDFDLKNPVDVNYPGLYLGIDIGGNSAKFALIYNGNFLVAPERFQFMSTNTAEKESPQSYMDRLSLHSRQIAQWARERGYGELDGVGVDMPGVVDIASNQMITIGQISSPENKDWTSDQIGEIKQLIPKLVTDLGLEDENSKISRGIIRNDMDGVLSGVLAVLNQLNHSFLEATGQVFRFDWMGTGHGFQFSIGAPLPAPTEGGHIIYNFGEKGSLIYDTESETSIPRLIQIAIDAGFPKDELIDDEGRFHMLPLGQALVEGGKESDSRRHAIAVEVYEAFAQAYAKNLVVGFQLAEMTGIVNASNVLLGGGIIRGETGKFVKTFVEKELEKLGYNGKINITLMSDEDVEKVIPKSDFLGPYGAASLAQQHVKNQRERLESDPEKRSEMRGTFSDVPEDLKQVVLQQLLGLISEIDPDEISDIQQLVINGNFRQAQANVTNLMAPFSPEFAFSPKNDDAILRELHTQLKAISDNLEKLIARSELRIMLEPKEFTVIPESLQKLLEFQAGKNVFRIQMPIEIAEIIGHISDGDFRLAKVKVSAKLQKQLSKAARAELKALGRYLSTALQAQKKQRSELRNVWKAPINPSAIKQRITAGKNVPTYHPLDVQLYEDGNAFGEVAAQKIIDKVREFPDAVIILPTGSTPGGMYRALIQKFKQDQTINFSQVRFFNLDEYLDLEDGHPLSYQVFMDKKLYEPLDAIDRTRAPKPENRNVPSASHMTRFAAYEKSSDTENYERLRASYEKRLQKAIQSTGRKAADIAFLGAGGAYPIEDHKKGGFLRDDAGEYILHGFHIGFNEPGSEVDSRTSIIPLTPKTRKDTGFRFGNITRRKDYTGQWKSVVPMRAISMGVANILESHEIVLMANGEEKSIVLERAYRKQKPDPDFPGSYLMYHPNVTWLVDHDAASRLPHTKRPWTVQGQVDFEWNQVTMRQAVMETLRESPDKKLTSLTAQDLVDMGISHYAIQKLGGLKKIKEDAATFLNPYISMADDLLPKNEDIVILSPHPDDDVITSAATMKKLQDRGNNVHVVYLVGGANAVRESFPAYKKEYQALREKWKLKNKNARLSAAENSKLKQEAKFLVRVHEAQRAAGVAGVPKENLHFLDLPYYFKRGFVDQNPIDPINDTQVLVDLLNKIAGKKKNRKLSVYFSAEQDPHGAHGIGADVGRQATQSKQLKVSKKRIEVLGYRGAYEEWALQNPENLVIIAFDEELMTLKKKAILEHASQVNPLFPSFDPREFWERVWDRNGETGRLLQQMGYLSEIETAAFAEVFRKFTLEEFLGRSELRTTFKNYARVFDPAKTKVLIRANPDPSGRFGRDLKTRKTIWRHDDGKIDDNVVYRAGPGQKVTHNVLRPWSYYLDQVIQNLRDQSINEFDAIILSLNNLYSNGWNTIYDGSATELYHQLHEPFQERTYPMFVVWKDGHLSSEDLEFVQKLNEKAGKARVYRANDKMKENDLSELIQSAFFGQRVLDNGQPGNLVEIAKRTSDLFHLYRFPQLVEKGRGDDDRDRYGPHFGFNELAAMIEANDDEKIASVVNRDGFIEIDLSRYESAVQEKGFDLSDVEEKALISQGYSKAENISANQVVTPKDLKVAEYFIQDRKLFVKLRPFPYPHNMMGITRSGKIVPLVFTGNKNKEIGVTLQELPEKIKALYSATVGAEGAALDPIWHVHLGSNSKDASIYTGDQTGRVTPTEFSSDKPYTEVKAMIFIVTPHSELRKIEEVPSTVKYKYPAGDFEVTLENPNKNMVKTSAGVLSVGMTMLNRNLAQNDADLFPSIFLTPGEESWVGADGSNLIQFYFAIAANWHFHGRKTKIVVKNAAERERIHRYLQLGNPYYLPEVKGQNYSAADYERFKREAIAIADRGEVDGSLKMIRPEEDMVDWVVMHDGEAQIDGVTITFEADSKTYKVVEGESEATLQATNLRSFEVEIEGIEALEKKPDFGMTFFGTSGGLDVKGLTSNQLVWAARKGVLMDAGSPTVALLNKLGITQDQMSGLVITHMHEDHVAGALEFFKWMQDGGRNFNLIIEPGIYELFKEQMSVVLGKNLEEVFKNFTIIQTPFNRKIQIKDVDDSFYVEAVPAFHGTPTASYRFDYKDQTISASSDTALAPLRIAAFATSGLPGIPQEIIEDLAIETEFRGETDTVFDFKRAQQIQEGMFDANESGNKPAFVLFEIGYGKETAVYDTNNHTYAGDLATLPLDDQERIITNHAAGLPAGKTFPFRHAKPLETIAVRAELRTDLQPISEDRIKSVIDQMASKNILSTKQQKLPVMRGLVQKIVGVLNEPKYKDVAGLTKALVSILGTIERADYFVKAIEVEHFKVVLAAEESVAESAISSTVQDGLIDQVPVAQVREANWEREIRDVLAEHGFGEKAKDLTTTDLAGLRVLEIERLHWFLWALGQAHKVQLNQEKRDAIISILQARKWTSQYKGDAHTKAQSAELQRVGGSANLGVFKANLDQVFFGFKNLLKRTDQKYLYQGGAARFTIRNDLFDEDRQLLRKAMGRLLVAFGLENEQKMGDAIVAATHWPSLNSIFLIVQELMPTIGLSLQTAFGPNHNHAFIRMYIDMVNGALRGPSVVFDLITSAGKISIIFISNMNAQGRVRSQASLISQGVHEYTEVLLERTSFRMNDSSTEGRNLFSDWIARSAEVVMAELIANELGEDPQVWHGPVGSYGESVNQWLYEQGQKIARDKDASEWAKAIQNYRLPDRSKRYDEGSLLGGIARQVGEEEARKTTSDEPTLEQITEKALAFIVFFAGKVKREDFSDLEQIVTAFRSELRASLSEVAEKSKLSADENDNAKWVKGSELRSELRDVSAPLRDQSLSQLRNLFERLQHYLGDHESRRWVAFHITQGIYLPLPADIDTNLRNDLINFIRYDLFHFDGVEEISETQNPAALDISIINAGVFGEFESAEDHLYAVAQNLTAQPKAYIHEIILVENENDVEALRERTQIEMKRFADQTRTWNLADRYKLEVVSRRELNRRINQIVSDRFENVRGAIDALTPAEFAQKHVTFSSDSRQVLDSLVSNIGWIINNDLDSRIAVQAVRLQKALELGSGADAALIRKLTGISAINRMISAANDLISAGELDKAVQLWNEMLSKRQIHRSA